MAYALHAYIVDPDDGTINVEHIFYGRSEREAESRRDQHLESCSYFRAAEKSENVIEELVEIDADEMPDPEDFEEEEEELEEEQAEPEDV